LVKSPTAASLHKVVIEVSILPYHWLNNPAKYFLGQWGASLHEVVMENLSHQLSLRNYDYGVHTTIVRQEVIQQPLLLLVGISTILYVLTSQSIATMNHSWHYF